VGYRGLSFGKVSIRSNIYLNRGLFTKWAMGALLNSGMMYGCSHLL
jgi:hypothetical protein